MDTTRALSENQEYKDPFGPSEHPESQSAFPITVCENGAIISEGISKREYFAGLAMSGYLACDHMGNTGQMPSYIAKLSVDMADALLGELNRKK